MTPVERCELAPGLHVSRVLTGMWQIADMERAGRTVDRAAAVAAMDALVQAGFTAFDMADHYGSAEEIAGVYRERHGAGAVQFLTKWVPAPGTPTRDEVRSAVERSLRRLRAERIDLLQLHAWTFADAGWLDRLSWLQELSERGLIRHVGVTNFDTAHLRIAVESGIRIASNQVSYSLLDRRAAGPMTDLCLRHGIRLLAYGTVAGGLLTERWLGRPEPEPDEHETWSRMKYGRFIRAAGGWDAFQEVLRAAQRVASRLGVSVANVGCRYILEQPAVCGIIIGARLGRGEHVAENLRLFDFSLDDATRAELDVALERLRPLPGDCGDEYRRPPYLTASGDLSQHLEALPPPWPAVTAPDGRTRVGTGTHWEEIGGYCRAVRRGDHVWIAGTTATHRGRVVGGRDAAAQTHFALDRIEGALKSLGGGLEHVVRTRIYVRDVSDWEAVARAHGERFRHHPPANTLVEARLIGEEYLVEVEAEAVIENG